MLVGVILSDCWSGATGSMVAACSWLADGGGGMSSCSAVVHLRARPKAYSSGLRGVSLPLCGSAHTSLPSDSPGTGH